MVAFFGPSGRVRFARVRAIMWALIGAVSFPLGWANSVILVWIASVYANVASEMATGEAADDKAVTDRLDRLESGQKRIEERQEQLFALLAERLPGDTPPAP